MISATQALEMALAHKAEYVDSVLEDIEAGIKAQCEKGCRWVEFDPNEYDLFTKSETLRSLRKLGYSVEVGIITGFWMIRW